MNESKTNVVVDDGGSKWSDLWKKEDYWAIWLGFLIILAGCILFLARMPGKFRETVDQANKTMVQAAQAAPYKTIEYYQAQDAKLKLRARDGNAGKIIAAYVKTPGKWTANPLDAFYASKAVVDAANEKAAPAAETAATSEAAALETAKAAQDAAAGVFWNDAALNKTAEEKIALWRKAQTQAARAKTAASGKGFNIFPTLLVLLLVFMAFFGAGTASMGQNLPQFAAGFAGVFIVAILAFMMGSQSTLQVYGVNAEVWAIVLGMVIANTVGTPSFVKPAIKTEYYIKTGLVLLGAEVLFDKVVAIGIPGIFVAWVVTPIVLVSTFIFGQKVLKLPSKTLNITISADMSVCGTSAAIATAAACRAKKEELTLAIGISLVFTAIMMIVMPIFIRAVGIPDVLGGAWIGGTIDSTGAVAAAGASLGTKAMYVAATIKMIQNVLIGIIAFFVALYWTTKVEPAEQGQPNRRVKPVEIWNRFPKFIIGFLGASILASLISGALGPDLSNAMINEGLVRGLTSPLRTWCFVLAFTSIGLGTNFRELSCHLKDGKPIILYVCGQVFNLILTLAMAYVMFYLVFPDITANI
jgi:uncharacterized integral membrane protein (TIGR00698 family)